MSETPKADALYEMLRPLAVRGSDWALRAQVRLMTADDAEAEADDLVVTLRRAVSLARPVLNGMHDWVCRGVEAAENHANGVPR